MAGRFDVFIVVTDVPEDMVLTVRNAVLRVIPGTTDFAITADERTEANADDSHEALPGM